MIFLLAVAFAGKTSGQTSGTKELYSWLKSQDFEPNPGLSAQFVPGSVVQTHSAKKANKEFGKGKELSQPLLFLRSDACFPGSNPETSAFVVPEGSGSSATEGSVAGKGPKLLPGFTVSASKAVSWSLAVDNPRRIAFAKADLSQNFSQECLEKITAAVNAGESLSWFGTVTEAILADALVVTVSTDTAMSTETKLSLGGALGKALPSAEIKTSAESEKSLTMRAEGDLLIGFRFRRMAAVEE